MARALDASPSGAVTEGTRASLLAALADERRAGALYQAVIDRYGRIMPFANIVHSERMHANHVEQLMAARGIEIPVDTTVIPVEEIPGTVAEAYRAGVEAELENIELYDRLITGVDDEAVREAFRQLRSMSEQRHLVAFRRFAGT
ncbi:MAG: DUF2202 domain-containing protein [Phycisphaerales bacterium]|nr:DUF2202 domain-containing protein [Phycisphaerales bacterium]